MSSCNIPFTLFAEVHCHLLGDALRDVHLSTQAGHTHVGWVGRNRYTTCTAQAGKKRSSNHQNAINAVINKNRIYLDGFIWM